MAHLKSKEKACNIVQPGTSYPSSRHSGVNNINGTSCELTRPGTINHGAVTPKQQPNTTTPKTRPRPLKWQKDTWILG
eukprot:5116575-Amphidinium_carterae.2